MGQSVPVQQSQREFGEFLAVFATILSDTVRRLDVTFGTVTDFVMATRPSRDLVVTMQDFDRLKQEFDALGDTLTRYAIAQNGAPLSGAKHAQLVNDLVAGISVHDLKERLMIRLQDDDGALPVISPEQEAEVDVDIVY